MILGRQPAFWIGLIVTLILGVVQTLLGEGLISDAAAGQVSSVVDGLGKFLVMLSPLIAGLLIRQQVYSPDTTQKIADRAAATGNTNIGEPPTGPTGPGPGGD